MKDEELHKYGKNNVKIAFIHKDSPYNILLYSFKVVTLQPISENPMHSGDVGRCD